MEKSFKLRPYYKSGTFVTALMLSPPRADRAMKNCGGKKSTIHLCGAQGFEVILIMLTKLVVIYMRFFWVCFWGLSLKWALLELKLLLMSSLGVFQEYFHKLHKEIISQRRNKRRIKNFKRGKSFRKGRSLIIPNSEFFCQALAGKFIFFCEVGRKVNTRTLSNARS